MEFFDWISIPEIIMSYVPMTAETAAEAAQNMMLYYIICLSVAGGLYLIGLFMGGFALMKMSKRLDMKNTWLGYLPFGNTYLTGKLAGETNFLGKKMKRAGLYAMIAEICYVLFEVAYLVVSMMFVNEDFFELVTVDESTQYWQLNIGLVSQIAPELNWLVKFSLAMEILAYVARFAALFLFSLLFFAFFRKYYVRGPLLMTVLCVVLPVRGFVLFAVRNNKPIDYANFMRRRMEEMYRSGGGSDDGPFNDFGGQGGYDTYRGAGGTSSDDNNPFSDF